MVLDAALAKRGANAAPRSLMKDPTLLRHEFEPPPQHLPMLAHLVLDDPRPVANGPEVPVGLFDHVGPAVPHFLRHGPEAYRLVVVEGLESRRDVRMPEHLGADLAGFGLSSDI